MRCTIFTRVANFCYHKVLQNRNSEFLEDSLSSLTIIPRNKHSISRKEISKNALKVLGRLNKAGFEVYLVGGGVRDLLLGKKPKDFDITTNATPTQLRKLFRNCRLVGRRFLLAHIMFGSEVIEVATFRGHHQMNNHEPKSMMYTHASVTGNQGMLLRDNIFGSIEEDAQRRDFSVNSLYYSVVDFTLRDYTGGMQDLQAGIIRQIGDPETRYREDPIRMLRAIRFAAKLGMTLSEETAEPIPRLATLLNHIPPMRLFEEALKLLQTGYGVRTYQLLCEHLLFQRLFPLVSRNFTKQGDSYMEVMLNKVLKAGDQFMHNNLYINPAFLFAAMLWYPMLEHVKKIMQERSCSYFNAFSFAMNDVIDEQCQTLAIPKRLINFMLDIWRLQLALASPNNKSFHNLKQHPKFRAAYDLFILRAEIENNTELMHLADWWDKLHVIDHIDNIIY